MTVGRSHDLGDCIDSVNSNPTPPTLVGKVQRAGFSVPRSRRWGGTACPPGLAGVEAIGWQEGARPSAFAALRRRDPDLANGYVAEGHRFKYMSTGCGCPPLVRCLGNRGPSTCSPPPQAAGGGATRRSDGGSTLARPYAWPPLLEERLWVGAVDGVLCRLQGRDGDAAVRRGNSHGAFPLAYLAVRSPPRKPRRLALASPGDQAGDVAQQSRTGGDQTARLQLSGRLESASRPFRRAGRGG